MKIQWKQRPNSISFLTRSITTTGLHYQHHDLSRNLSLFTYCVRMTVYDKVGKRVGRNFRSLQCHNYLPRKTWTKFSGFWVQNRNCPLHEYEAGLTTTP
jgi:hypothetical protein